MSIQVLIVDDHKILVSGIQDHFSGVEGIQIAGTAHSGEEALKAVKEVDPDVVLMDIGLPDINGIECTKRIMKTNPTIKVIGLSTYMEISVVKKLLHEGAVGYVSKATEIEHLEEAIRNVHEGQRFLGPEVTQVLMNDFHNATLPPPKPLIPKLTNREVEVLALIADEATSQEIGEKLFISINTVESHRKNLISKFGVRNSVGLVKKAMEWGLLEE